MAHTRKKMFYAPKAFNGYGPPEPPIPAAQDRPGRYPCPCCGQITLPVPPEEAVASQILFYLARIYAAPLSLRLKNYFIANAELPSGGNVPY